MGVGDRTSRQRLECGGFSTALERSRVYIGSWACGAHESGGERAALQTLRVREGHFQTSTAGTHQISGTLGQPDPHNATNL